MIGRSAKGRTILLILVVCVLFTYSSFSSAALGAEIAASMVPNDPLYADQLQLYKQIGMDKMWEKAPDTRKTIIALIDTGVDLNHPDLKGNLVTGRNMLQPGKLPQDDHGHGTKVAGILAAQGNNREGVTGLLWSASIMPIKALDRTGAGDEDVLCDAIHYAVDHNARIVVLSVGLNRKSARLDEAVRYAESHDVLLVAAVGNDGIALKKKAAIQYPAAFPTVLAVGGIAKDNKAEPDSNTGSEIDLVAPWNVLTTTMGGGYNYDSGSSMAAPQVAAIAAMAMARYPNMKPYQIRNLLRQTAQDVGVKGWDPATGYGIIRADRVMTALNQSDMYESNNQKLTAKQLPLGKMISGTIASDADVDWLMVDVPDNGKLTFYIRTDTASVKSLLVLNEQGMGSDSRSELALGQSAFVFQTTEGKKYFKIMNNAIPSDKLNNLGYRLTIVFQQQADSYEINDIESQAHPLIVDGLLKVAGNFHRSGDQDWFIVPIKKKGFLRITLQTDTSRIDPSFLYRRQGQAATEVDVFGEGITEQSELFPVTPGNYYIRVTNAITSYPSAVIGHYTLSITYAAKDH